MNRDGRGEVLQKTVWWLVGITMAVSALVVAVSMAMAPVTTDDPHGRVKSDYVLMLAQCLLGLVALGLPRVLARRAKVLMPSRMLIGYALFLYCSIYLGEVRGFYFLVPHWDTVLHAFSGFMLGALGFSVIDLLNRADEVPMKLSPDFVAMFAFCFGVTLGVLWEIYEFTADSVLLTNMQKYGPRDGEAFVGRAALMDTMADLLVDAAGALASSLIGFASLKHKKRWIDRFRLKRMNQNTK